MAKNKGNMLKPALKSRVANGISNWQRCLSKGLKNKEVWEKKEGHMGKEKGLFLPEQALMKGGEAGLSVVEGEGVYQEGGS